MEDIVYVSTISFGILFTAIILTKAYYYFKKDK